MFKAHSKSFVFLGLQASGSDCSLNTCCVSLFKPPHWGEKSYWWEALKTGTGLCMMPKRHHGGGKMAQGLKWKGQRWAAQIHSVLSKSWRRSTPGREGLQGASPTPGQRVPMGQGRLRWPMSLGTSCKGVQNTRQGDMEETPWGGAHLSPPALLSQRGSPSTTLAILAHM